jgi:hypothetical protein
MATVGSDQSGMFAPRLETRTTQVRASAREPLAERATSSLALWLWVELARRHQMPIERFCQLAGVTAAELRDPETRFSQGVANHVAELAYQHFGRGAAMAAALTVEAGHFNLFELLARTAPTVGHAMADVCRFFSLVHHGGRLVHETSSDGSHTLRWEPPGYEVHPAYGELTFAVLLLTLRRETGEQSAKPIEIRFRARVPSDLTLHERVFGRVPSFGMPDDRMTFDARVAALSLERKNPALHAVAIRTALELIDD